MSDALTLHNAKDRSILVVADQSTKIKRWTLGAERDPQNDALVYVAMQNPSGEYMQDPVSRKVLNG